MRQKNQDDRDGNGNDTVHRRQRCCCTLGLFNLTDTVQRADMLSQCILRLYLVYIAAS